LCAIGLVESVLTLQAVDQILDQQTVVWKKNQECLAQGLANLASGFFKAMGGDAMIGQSTINVLNGAKGRLSAITDACFLMIYICSLSNFIEAVPTAGLAGILFVVVIHTFNWPSLSIIFRRALPMYMCVTIVVVTVLSVLTNLALGIGVGILWECVIYVWREGKELDVQALKQKNSESKVYRVAGNVFFANADDVNSFFTPSADPENVVCDLANARLLDFSAIFTLNNLGRRYELAGKKFSVEMKDDDYDRYMAVSDEAVEGGGRIRKLLPTKATKSIEGKVKAGKLEEFRYQEFYTEKLESVKEHVEGSHKHISHATWLRPDEKDPWAPHKAESTRKFSKERPPTQLTENKTQSVTQGVKEQSQSATKLQSSTLHLARKPTNDADEIEVLPGMVQDMLPKQLGIDSRTSTPSRQPNGGEPEMSEDEEDWV
jgi:MFS superfamily sulfate permease-like transporter